MIRLCNFCKFCSIGVVPSVVVKDFENIVDVDNLTRKFWRKQKKKAKKELCKRGHSREVIEDLFRYVKCWLILAEDVEIIEVEKD